MADRWFSEHEKNIPEEGDDERAREPAELVFDDDRTLQEVIGRGAPSAAHLAYQLVGLANQRGGSDNCTVAAVYCY